MTILRNGAAMAAVVLLAACGGESAPPTAGPTPTPTPTTATLNVTLSQASADIAIAEGGSASFGFDATYTGSSTDPIVADVAIGGRRYVLDGTPSVSGKTFAVRFKTKDLPAGGKSTTDVTFRLCKTTSCNTVYPGSQKTFPVTLDVQLGDWGMFQRNPRHTGFVAAHYDPADFKDAWTWNTATQAITLEMSATRGSMFVTERTSTGERFVHSISTADASKRWSRSLGDQAYASGPSYADGRVFVTSMVSSSGTNPQWVLDANDGRVIQQMTFAAQWHDFAQPTVLDGSVYVAAGYYGNVVYSFDYASGTKNWEGIGYGGNIWDGQTVAADSNFVYYYSGAAMDVISRSTGKVVQSLLDPNFDWRGYSWDGAPVIGDSGLIFGFSSPRNYTWDTKIAGYSRAAGGQIWISANRYTTAPAYANGRVFAARHNLQLIDAMNEETGAVEFSMALPGSSIASSNVVIADNLLFVSSGAKTYAFDMAQSGYPIVWETDAGGQWLALSPDNHLLIGSQESIRAIQLF